MESNRASLTIKPIGLDALVRAIVADQSLSAEAKEIAITCSAGAPVEVAGDLGAAREPRGRHGDGRRGRGRALRGGR